MTLHLLDLPADRVEGDVVVALYFEDQRPLLGPAALLDWRLNGLLTGMLLRGAATGKAGEHLLLPSNDKIAAPRILFIGGGSWRGLSPETYGQLVRHALETCRQARLTRAALCLNPLPGMKPTALEELVAGVLAGMDAGGLNCLLSIEGDGPARSQSRRS